jgi:hypothetical protein
MTPQSFWDAVVQPNVEDALQHPGNIRHVSNALQCMDAVVRIAYWHLHDLGDSRGNLRMKMQTLK